MAVALSLVARRIQEVRLAKKLSRQELADRLAELARERRIERPQFNYLQVYRHETGVSDVSAEAAALYADALEVSVASLFRESKAAS